MRRGLPNSYQQRNTQLLETDAGYLNAVAMSNFGMDAKTLDSVLNVMMAVSQGNMPDAKHMTPVYEMAQQKYGWDKNRVQAEMKTAISQASPQERVAAYLSANNKDRVDPNVYTKAIELVQHGLRGDLEASIQNRLAENKTVNSADRRFEWMEADKRVADDTRDKASLRQMLETLTGHNKAPTYENRVERILKARSQLADRVELQASQRAAGHQPSLKESLSSAYDEQYVAKASEDLGLGNPIEEARSNVETESGHMSDDFDVTKDL